MAVASPPTILIVDDDQAILSLLALTFKQGGYEVTVAATASDAMALFGEDTVFHAVLSDVDMPGMDGHELARWIFRNHPNTICLLMSGFGSECTDCPLVGQCLLLRKPFVPNDAVAVMTRKLNARRDSKEL